MGAARSGRACGRCSTRLVSPRALVANLLRVAPVSPAAIIGVAAGRAPWRPVSPVVSVPAGGRSWMAFTVGGRLVGWRACVPVVALTTALTPSVADDGHPGPPTGLGRGFPAGSVDHQRCVPVWPQRSSCRWRHMDTPPISAGHVFIRTFVPALPAPHVVASDLVARHGQRRYTVAIRPTWVAAWADPPQVAPLLVQVRWLRFGAIVTLLAACVIQTVDIFAVRAFVPAIVARPAVGSF